MGKIILFYKYIDLENPTRVLKWQQKLCRELGLKGRIIIATEGINGTLGGHTQAINQYVECMRADQRFADIDFKESDAHEDHFPRLRIVIKKEIVNLGIDPATLKAKDGGIHLEPNQVHNLIADQPQDLVILDCRNSFESAIGSFENAIKPSVAHFRDFPSYVDENLDQFKDKQVLMFCTGGVRCERGSAYIKSKGVAKEIYQLKGGIHRYIEQFPDGYFRGKNYVFDGRVAVQVNEDVLGKCHICQSACDEYTNCLNAACNRHFIGCASCINQYQNTCGDNCHELVYQKNVPKRPMRKTAYDTTECQII